MTLVALALALTGCTGGTGDKKPAGDDTGATEGPNPIVPEQYELLWDTDASSCDDEAIVYWLFDGDIDDAGNLVGTERWYWFFAAEGWDGDCYNTFDVVGEEGELGWETSPCSGCDREFLATWTLDEDEEGDYVCQGYGYESMFDDDTRDRIDDEEYYADVMLDPLSPSGNVNEDMLVFTYFQDDQSEYSYNARTDARGTYTPGGDDYESGPAHLDWTLASGTCVDFE
jgi:hypothetical protein